jgi:hypothetical protein
MAPRSCDTNRTQNNFNGQDLENDLFYPALTGATSPSTSEQPVTPVTSLGTPEHLPAVGIGL